jgi:hypothetical protein
METDYYLKPFENKKNSFERLGHESHVHKVRLRRCKIIVLHVRAINELYRKKRGTKNGSTNNQHH